MKAPSAVSNQWGSYFVDVHRSGGGDEESQKLTWCCHCIHKYSTMAIPSVEHIAGMWTEAKRWCAQCCSAVLKQQTYSNKMIPVT